MKTVEVTQQNFAEVAGRGIVLIDFWASWCGPCRAFAPVFDKAAERHPDVVFGKVNTDVESALSEAFGIRSIPTLMVIRDGVLIGAQAGALPGDVLDELIREVRGLDMAAIEKATEKKED